MKAEDEVAKLYRALIDAWNRRDADAMGELFAENGSVVGFDGSPLDGRARIASSMREIFAHHPTASYVSKLREVRLLGDQAAVLRAVAGMVPPGGHDLNPEVNAIQTLVAHRQGDRWLIAAYQNTPAAFHGRPEEREKLTEELRQVMKAAKA